MELIFSYRAGASFLHRADPRTKLLGLLVFSIAAAGAGPIPLAGACLAALLLLLRCCGIRQGSAYLFSLARFMLVVGLFMLAALLLQGSLPDYGLLIPFLLRLLLWVLVGFLLTATTSLASLRGAVYTLFRRIPGFPAARLALLLTVTVGALPLFFSALRLNREALAVRGRVPWYRPLRKIRVSVIPLLTRMLRRADLLSDSLISRGFSGDRSFDLPPLPPRELLLLAIILPALLFLMYLPPLLGYTQ